MTLDDLAAAVVGAEPTDLQGLARIHQGLQDLRGTKDLPDAADPLVAEAARCVEQIILAECADPLAVLRELERKVAELQGLCDSAMRPINTTAGATTAPSETTPSPAQAPATAAPDAASQPAARPDPSAPTTIGAAAGESDSLGSDPSLLAEFVTESREHLENAEGALLDLETNPENAEGINAIFRAFHTIKGTSGFLGLTRINAVAHKAETLLDRARKGEIRLAGGYADLALEATDVLKRLVEQVRSRLDGSVEAEPEGVDALLDRLDAPEEPAPATPAPLRLGDILVARGQADRRQVEQVAAKAEPGPIGAKLVSAGVADARSVAEALRIQQQASGAAESDATLRVSMARLDKLIDMVGELVIAQSMVSQDPLVRNASSHTLMRKVAQSDKITRELQDLTLSMRMVPLKGTFQKMARLVRDLGRKSGKQVRFVAEGEDTEIDRNMVDAIADPLVHMMRNAVDHGLETPEERIRQGKPPEGVVVLRAYHAAGKVVIEVQDDGRGIDPDRILAKAVERGIIEPGRELSQSEVFELLFAPGFSTAEKVTDVSGRGVGMDVVKKNIEAMRGRVDISSTKGRGSTFTIRLPLTLAIIDGMLLKVGGETYVLPTVNIEQAFRPEPAALSTVKGQGEMVLLRGRLVPMFRLHRLLGVRGACEDPTAALLVVVEYEGQRCAFLADALLGQQQVVIKSLGRALGDIDGVSGAAILGDGRVGLILDVGGVLRIARGDSSAGAA